MFQTAQHLLVTFRLLAHQINRYLHARQRRAQIMRDIVQQPFLALHQLADLAAHAVRFVTQLPEFVTTVAHLLTDIQVKPAMRHRAQTIPQQTDRMHQITGK